MTASRYGFAMVLTLATASGCTDLDSATNLVTEGPPMVRQVRMKEVVVDQTTGSPSAPKKVFAFGTHVDAATRDYPAAGPNGQITAPPMSNPIRIIMDELLVGNALEEIECRFEIDGTNRFDRVPLGTTPDDIAKCASTKDVLPSACPSTMATAVCICRNAAGCGPELIKQGEPVGVLDQNADGAADNTRFIAGAVGIKCGNFDVPLDVDNSYWNPSGDQNKPAMGGFDALGPAIVIAASTEKALPTSTECQLTFANDVVDKQGERVCIPANGDVTAGCTPGDMNAFKFRVDQLRLQPSFVNGGTGVSTSQAVALTANAPIAPGTLTAVTVETMGGTPVTVPISLSQPNSIKLDFMMAPLSPMTMYVVKVTTSLTDAFGQPLTQMQTYTFTTGA